MRRISPQIIFKDKKGIALIICYLVVLVLSILGSAFLIRSVGEKKSAQREKDSVQAFYIAEAGLERALYDLKCDFECSPAVPSWQDDAIYTSATDPTANIDISQGGTQPIPQNYPNFYLLPYGTAYDHNLPPISTSLGGGSFAVELANVAGEDDEIWIRSTGTFGGLTRTIQTRVRIDEISIWDNAIFAGAGSGGRGINGNAGIHGSVHILGTGLASTDIAISLTGSASIENNYSDMPNELSSRVPACPQVTFGGETVDSLSAKLRVKNGRVDLSGSGKIGKDDVPFINTIKETVDGIYINVGSYDGDNTAGTYYDGFGGNKGASNVYSDNGTANSYDLGDDITFPSLDDPYLTYPSCRDYLTTESLSVSEDVLSNIDSSQSYYTNSNSYGSITWDPTASPPTLTISGVVRITDGADADTDGNISIGEKGMTIEYTDLGSGSGIIFADNVEIHGDLLSQGTFPTTNCLGVIADANIDLATDPGDSQLKIIGVFYAEDKITSAKQNELAGTFISNYFDMGSNVPKIYQVPELTDNLPLGMPESSIWRITTIVWQEI